MWEREPGGGGKGVIALLVPDKRSTLVVARLFTEGGGGSANEEVGLGNRGGEVDGGLEDDIIGTKVRLFCGGGGLLIGAEG